MASRKTIDFNLFGRPGLAWTGLSAVLSIAAIGVSLCSIVAEAAAPGVPPDPRSKIASCLRDAKAEADGGRTLPQIAAANEFIKPVGDAVRVDVRLDTVPDDALASALAKAGLNARATFGGMISGTCTLAALEAIAGNPHVTTIHPDYGCRTRNAGSAPDQADATLRAAIARSTYGVDGTGINVGILSDSIKDVIGGTITNACLTGSSSQASGNLPPQVGVLNSGPGGGTDEGAGMAELIHDLAPGSNLAFHSAFNSIPDFAQGIIELASSSGCGRGGCQIICDDVVYFAEPMFQDGEIAQAVESVVSIGVTYFSSAGNEADSGLQSPYRGMTSSSRSVHDFTGSGDPFLDVTYGLGGARVIAVLQWNQPFSGTLGPGSQVDLNLYLVSSTSNWAKHILASSTDTQGNTGAPFGDPLEVLSYTAPSPGTRYLVIEQAGEPTAVTFRLVIFAQGSVTFQTGVLGGPTIYGHTAAANANSVAAVYYREVNSGGSTQGGPGINVESFTSKGGSLPFYFTGNGQPLPGAPVFRFKPDLASVDGTNTSFFGSPDTDSPPDGFPNFFGTSAAAPHLAAIAALLLDRSSNLGLSLTPAQVQATMRSSAVDIEAAGRDPLSGDGLVLADAALAALCTAPSLTNQPSSQAVCVGSPATLCVSASGSPLLGYQWKKNGAPIAGATSACYTINQTASADTGSYTCVISNSCGSIESNAASLVVNPMVAPDLDGDCSVDDADWTVFAGCVTGPAAGPPSPDCTNADFDLDGDVDQSDFGLLQRCLSGAGQPVDPNCMSN